MWTKFSLLNFAVSLGRILCPQEAGIVCAHLYSDASVMSSSGPENGSRKRKPSVDLNEEPAQRLAELVGVAVVEESKERRLESLRQRCISLQKACKLPLLNTITISLLFH